MPHLFTEMKMAIALLAAFQCTAVLAESPFGNKDSYFSLSHSGRSVIELPFSEELKKEEERILFEKVNELVQSYRMPEFTKTHVDSTDIPSNLMSGADERLRVATYDKVFAIDSYRISQCYNAWLTPISELTDRSLWFASPEKSIALSFGAGELALREVKRDGVALGRCRCLPQPPRITTIRFDTTIIEGHVVIIPKLEDRNYRLIVLADGRLFRLTDMQQPRLIAQIDPRVWENVRQEITTMHAGQERAFQSGFGLDSNVYSPDEQNANKAVHYSASQQDCFSIEFSTHWF